MAVPLFLASLLSILSARCLCLSARTSCAALMCRIRRAATLARSILRPLGRVLFLLWCRVLILLCRVVARVSRCRLLMPSVVIRLVRCRMIMPWPFLMTRLVTLPVMVVVADFAFVPVAITSVEIFVLVFGVFVDGTRLTCILRWNWVTWLFLDTLGVLLNRRRCVTTLTMPRWATICRLTSCSCVGVLESRLFAVMFRTVEGRSRTILTVRQACGSEAVQASAVMTFVISMVVTSGVWCISTETSLCSLMTGFT